MKTPDKQIIMMLQAFEPKDVIKAFKLYELGMDTNDAVIKEQLLADGWAPFDKKHMGKENYFFQGKYWIQSDAERNKEKERFLKEHAKLQKTKSKNAYTGQKMELEQAPVICSICGAKMYKQAICNGCKEGKQGFKLRLICEENPDHEVLL